MISLYESRIETEVNSDMRPVFTSKILPMRSKLQRLNHLGQSAMCLLCMNANVICVMQIM